MEWVHDGGRLIRFKIGGESNLILPHYSTCLEIILNVWDSSLEGNSTSASSHPVQHCEMCSFPSAHPVLCPQGSLCSRTAQQVSGSSFLAQDFQDEKLVIMVKTHWHEGLWLWKFSAVRLQFCLRRRKQRGAYGHMLVICKYILALAN